MARSSSPISIPSESPKSSSPTFPLLRNTQELGVQPPHSTPPSYVVDRALEHSVKQLSKLLQQKGGPSTTLDTDADTHELLTNIKSHLKHLSLPQPQHVEDDEDYEEDEGNFTGYSVFDQLEGQQDFSKWSPPRQQQPSPTPFDVWKARRHRQPARTPLPTMTTTSTYESIKISEEEWGSLIHRLNDSLKRHKVQVASAQQDLLASELSHLTFHPNINEKSRKLSNLQSLPQRSAQIENQRKLKLQAERDRLKDKELDGLTFKPKINTSSTQSRVMSPSRVASNREALALRLAAQRDADDRETLTFSPSLNPKSLAMAPHGKALAAATSFSPSKPTFTRFDVGHEQETFRPEINKKSKRLAASKTKPVYERLYEDRLVKEQKEISPTKRSGVRTNIVVYKPEYEFILKTLGES